MIICNQSRGYGVNLKLRILDQGIEARADIVRENSWGWEKMNRTLSSEHVNI